MERDEDEEFGGPMGIEEKEFFGGKHEIGEVIGLGGSGGEGGRGRRRRIG